MLEKTEGVIKNGQSRETGNTGYTRQTKQKTTTHKQRSHLKPRVNPGVGNTDHT